MPPEWNFADVWETVANTVPDAIARNATFFKPIVAAINGHAHAGGAEFLLSTDIRIMSSEATIAVKEVRRGLIAGGGSLARLARQIPWAHAMELILVGEPITAQQALAIGLVNRVVPPKDVVPTAEQFARKISQSAPVALLKSKEAIVRGSGATRRRKRSARSWKCPRWRATARRRGHLRHQSISVPSRWRRRSLEATRNRCCASSVSTTKRSRACGKRR